MIVRPGWFLHPVVTTITFVVGMLVGGYLHSLRPPEVVPGPPLFSACLQEWGYPPRTTIEREALHEMDVEFMPSDTRIVGQHETGWGDEALHPVALSCTGTQTETEVRVNCGPAPTLPTFHNCSVAIQTDPNLECCEIGIFNDMSKDKVTITRGECP